MSKFFEELTFYEETDFKGKKKSVPPWVFENCYTGKKVLSVKIPNGVYLTLFKGGTAEQLVTDQTVTYSSDTADISSFSTTITGYIIQTNTIKSTFPLSTTTSYPASLKDKFLDYRSTFYTFKEGTSESLNITTAIGLQSGNNIVTLTDEFNKEFTLYGNVIYLPAYLKVITKASVVPLPVLKPPAPVELVPSPAPIVTNASVTLDKDTAVKKSKSTTSSNVTYYIVVSIVVFMLLLILIYILKKKKKRPTMLR